MRRYRKRYSRKRNRTGKGWGSTFKTVGQVAKTAFKIAKGVASVLNVEYKHFDKNTTLSPNTAGLVYHLTNMPQGDNDNQRNGNSIKAKSLYLRGEISMSTFTPQNSPVSQYYRYILVVDKECKGAAPTPADILQIVNWNSPLNMNNDYQWLVLKDKLVTLDNAKQRSKPIKIFQNLNMHIKYQGAGATIADARNNQIFLLVISNETNPDVLPSMNFYSRLRYIDN